MKIAVVGAGFTGLTTAYRLSKHGHQVVLFEKKPTAGGLGACFKQPNWTWPVENFYHHFFISDVHLKNLLTELNLGEKLFYRRPKTSIFTDNKIGQLDSPLSLLVSPQFDLTDKGRAGLATAYLKLVSDWKSLEKKIAWTWLKQFYGREVFVKLWQPLLEAKFGPEAKNISLAWFWARIKKRSARLGYLEGGSQTLIDKLGKEIEKNGGKIVLNHEIRRFDDLSLQGKHDRVIFTTPASVFVNVMGSKLPAGYRQRLTSLKMAGAVCLVLELKKTFLTDKTYWLNVNAKNFPFVAVVEHTNFIDRAHYDGKRILYVGGYYPPKHRYFKTKKESVLKEFLPFLQKINPDYDFPRSVVSSSLATDFHAQPIVPINYSKMVPLTKTPVKNVFLANMQMVYPWDRGINFAIELGERVSREIP